jgi:hypothetical protein
MKWALTVFAKGKPFNVDHNQDARSNHYTFVFGYFTSSEWCKEKYAPSWILKGFARFIINE